MELNFIVKYLPTGLFPSVVGILGLFWVIYGIWLAVYRLYLSPIAKFPGPKLAALTQWYEIYFDMVKRGGGQFPFEIKRMHEKYGPIVRVNPFELHVDDPEYYDTIYATSKPYDKMEHFQYRFNVPLATFSTSDQHEHRIRRAAISPFFSKSRVRGQNDQIQGLMDRISHRLTTEYAGTGRILQVADMWGCYSADAIMDIVFARPKHFSEYPNFQSPFSVAIRNMTTYAHLTLHFGWVLSIMNCIPRWVTKALIPPFRPIIEFQEEMDNEIAEVLAGRNQEAKAATQPTVFHDILSSSLPQHELRPARLNDEALGLVGAGTETTSWSLTIGTLHILDNPCVLKELKAELIAAMPDINEPLPWNELEKLPYLDAVIKETLRIAYGGVERLPRINRAGTWKYGKWDIPPGTPVGMDQYHMHTNPQIYPEAHLFKPERWLGNPRGPDGVKPLTYYLTAFAKGTRMCTGMNLAYAEVFIGLATLFRRHDFELFETTRRDVEFYAENLKACPWPGSKGVRVKVLASSENI
ncbi:putative cytochrome p450 protein [Botrytis fragariae]|uniref:Putative cytochrome p450 protein n=1 Tax=Botrytis fragariae TaxID=1964551 RepID=A0A8H6B2W3_9HELO|nr:putative cytochrome p450 protein [Botrytis fragariae]KAF5878017.1 putative cytochrome p450 protein [Botrytis fragariae]